MCWLKISREGEEVGCVVGGWGGQMCGRLFFDLIYLKYFYYVPTFRYIYFLELVKNNFTLIFAYYFFVHKTIHEY